MKYAPINYKTPLLSLLTVSLISACGGGGGGADPVTPPVQVTPPVTLADYAGEASGISLSSVDSLLQISFLAHNTLFTTAHISANREGSCFNGGVYEQTLTDNDDNSVISAGDQVTVTYRECYSDNLNSVANGTVRYDVTALKEQSDYDITIDASSLTVDESINLVGSLSVNYQREDTQSVMTVTTSTEIDVDINGDTIITLSNMEIVKREDFAEAQYSVSVDGDIRDEALNGTYSLSQVTPFSGYFDEFPNEGEITISTSGTESITVTANFVEDSALYDVQYKDDSFSLSWDSTIDGAITGLNGQRSSYIYEFRSDNFDLVSILNTSTLTNYGLNDSYQLVFSRPVESFVASYGEMAFQAEDWPFDKVLASVEINGALVTITPEESLMADTYYDVSSFIVTSFNQHNYDMYVPSVRTRDDIIPMVTWQTNLYRFNDTPTLSAEETGNNTNGELTYQWQELSDSGVVFETPNAASTTFTVPETADSELAIEVVITSEYGYSVNEKVLLTYVAPLRSILSFDSPVGDFVGGGEQRLFTENEGVFTFTNHEEAPHYLSVDYQTDDWWTLDLASPTDEVLGVGVYEGATRWPFQSPTGPGLDFSGAGRGCNELSGRFEILELSYDENGNVESLAVNFEQNCEKTMPTLKGLVRHNSSVPLN
ncbi:hypothetical protein J8L84_19555 [Alteromonas sp. MMG017]|uniref:hypothetical protein n=1 Tax=Alteromonas sp. MMG017 TaxID=2822692 RepID=UPI001B3A4191|nr:hypothetical protein [Alteromonas sp. MMG017]